MLVLTSRAEVLEGKTVRLQTARGKVYVTMNRLEGRLHEVFITHGKAGGNDAAMAEALSRLISLALQAGAHPTHVVKQIRGISDAPIWLDGRQIMSLPDAVAQAILEDGAKPAEPQNPARKLLDQMAEARSKLEFLDVPCYECKWYTIVVIDGVGECATCGHRDDDPPEEETDD